MARRRSSGEGLWRIDIEGGPDLAEFDAWLRAASPVAAEPSIEPVPASEAEAFEQLYEAALGGDMHRQLESVEIVRLDASDRALAWLLRSPEPIDWRRLGVRLERAERILPAGRPASGFKLVGAQLGSDSRLDVLLLETGSLADVQIDIRPLAADGWQRWATFDSVQPPLPAGRVVSLTGPALIRTGVEVRLARGGRVLHQRAFLPASDYAPQAGLRWLRRQDGTACALTIFSGTSPAPLRPGAHRLSLSYHRDLRALDPQLEVLSQGGDRSPERVVVELPWETADDGPDG